MALWAHLWVAMNGTAPPAVAAFIATRIAGGYAMGTGQRRASSASERERCWAVGKITHRQLPRASIWSPSLADSLHLTPFVLLPSTTSVLYIRIQLFV